MALVNGTKLGQKATSTGTEYTYLAGLKEVPDIGVEPEKVENTALDASNKTYEVGVGDVPDLTYKFKFKNSAATDAYRVLSAAASAGTSLYWSHELADGTKFTFEGQVSVKVHGGSLNTAQEFSATVYPSTDITVTNPSA